MARDAIALFTILALQYFRPASSENYVQCKGVLTKRCVRPVYICCSRICNNIFRSISSTPVCLCYYCTKFIVSIELQLEMSTPTSYYVPLDSTIQISCTVRSSETIRWTVRTAGSIGFLLFSELVGIQIEEIPPTPLSSTQNQGQLIINSTLELNGATVRCGARTGNTVGNSAQATLIVQGK